MPTQSSHANQTIFPAPANFIAELKPQLVGFSEPQWVDSTGSTNADLMMQVRQLNQISKADGSMQPIIRGAHLQTAGKGRAGRNWLGKSGSTLMFSCAFAVNIPIAQLSGVSPAIGIATCEALRALVKSNQAATAPAHASDRLTLKWPNDLQWDCAKLAGILIESAGKMLNQSSIIVIGIGLNLNQADALSVELNREIADWSMVLQATQSQTSTNAITLVVAIAHAWSRALSDFATEGFETFQGRFDKVNALAGQNVAIQDRGETLLTGLAQGVDRLGQLQVKTAAGLVPVLVGDVSVRST